MGGLVTDILEVSFRGSIVILVVLVLRLVLKGAPRNTICLLWLMAAVRLLMPFQISSPMSLQPDLDTSIRVQTQITQENIIDIPISDETPSNAIPEDTSGWPDDVVVSTGDALSGDTTNTVVDYTAIAGWVWMAGVVVLIVYATVSYVNLKRRVEQSSWLEDGLYLCPGLDSAFVLGYVKPRIYLPQGLDGDALRYVVAHERAHIARKDHIWKLFGFGVLTIHWFNPLVWLAYSLYCKDLEMACDERVVRNMDTAQRKAYSMALVACAAKGHTLGACPVAFGEIDVKGRVKAVLNYKKPKFWIILVAMVAVIAVAVCFLTSPTMTDEEILDNFYAEVEELQNRENIHLLVTEELETENPYLLDRQQEYWISGDDWYGVYTYNFTQGLYEICVAQVDGFQKCCKRSDDFEVADNGIWQEVYESNYHHMAQLLTTDWTEATVEEIRREDGGYKVIVRGDHADESQYTTYENYYTFHLNHDGELVGVTRYDRSETIHKVFDLSGWYETATTCTYTFLEADNAAFCELVNQAFGGSMSGANDQEADDLKLEREEEERRREEALCKTGGLDPNDYEIYKKAFYAAFGEEDKVVLADVTHDGRPEMLVVNVLHEGFLYEGYVYTIEDGAVRQIYSNSGTNDHAGGFYGWYLKETADGYNLGEEFFNMWQGHGMLEFVEYYLDESGRKIQVERIYVDSEEHHDETGAVTVEAYEEYFSELSDKIAEFHMICNTYTESDESYMLLDADPNHIFME